MRRGVTHDMTKHRKNSWKILYLHIIFHTVTWQAQFSFHILHIFQLDRSIRQAWLKYCVTFDFGAWKRNYSYVFNTFGDICVAFVWSWWNLWYFWSKLVKFVVKVDEIYEAFGERWQNLWCSRSKLMKFLVFLVKLVKFVVLLVICRLCRGKNYGRTNPPKCGKCSALLGGKTFLFVHFVFCVSSVHICRVFN